MSSRWGYPDPGYLAKVKDYLKRCLQQESVSEI